MINIILWEMGNLKWPNPYNLCVCINWRGANSHYKDHVASLSYMLAFQRQCNLRQCWFSNVYKVLSLNQKFYALSHSIKLVFLSIRKTKEFKITKRYANQSTINHLTGPLEENFIATDINHLLITKIILLMDNMWLNISQLRVT